MEQGETILLSLHPQHAQKILSGEKKLEFRRSWATRQVSLVVIYATRPTKKIVAIARVKEVHYGPSAVLWDLAKRIGGGLSKTELFDYFHGRKAGFAIELESVHQFSPALEPHLLLKDFRAPQSFTYLDQKIVTQLVSLWKEQNARGPVVFVAGVHGVGKTTLCEGYAKTHAVQHKSASQLIRDEKASALTKSGKLVKDIAGNQRLLIEAVQNLKSTGEILLLDGHFALLNAKNVPQPLPKDVFADLGINAVIAIHDKPSAIAARLTVRDTEALDASTIADLQAMELLQAEKVCRELCIPFFKIRSFDQESFSETISKISLQRHWRTKTA